MKISDVFNGGFTLSHKIAIYVPTRGGHNQEVFDNTDHVRSVSKRLSEWFGGATTVDGVGSFISEDFGLIEENVQIVYAFATEGDLKKHLSELVQYAAGLKGLLAQESIAIELDGELTLL